MIVALERGQSYIFLFECPPPRARSDMIDIAVLLSHLTRLDPGRGRVQIARTQTTHSYRKLQYQLQCRPFPFNSLTHHVGFGRPLARATYHFRFLVLLIRCWHTRVPFCSNQH